MTQDPSRTKSKNFDILDPLGEIRSRAKELFAEAGSPAGRTWEDFFDRAEHEMIDGGSEGQVAGTSRAPSGGLFGPRAYESVAPELRSIVGEGPVLDSVVAFALKKPAEDHESLCLSNILQNHSFVFSDGAKRGPLSIDEVAALLAGVAGEYDQGYLEKVKADSSTLPQAAKVQYWKEKLQAVAQRDEALTFADQNTIRRLIAAMRADGRIQEMVYK